jgi:hypothetical protein
MNFTYYHLKITKIPKSEMTRYFIAFITLLASSTASPQTPIPTLVEKDGRHALLVDGKPFLILGAQAHNSSAWPAILPQVWGCYQFINANTLELPIYWEQIEPEPDHFDFSLLDTIVAQARGRKTHLILLWFATWKNGSNHYMPVWMKLHPDEYPNCIGPDGKPVDSPSPVADATLTADKKAFAAVMRHLRTIDPDRTVIMVQVENEPGSWYSIRDYSPAARKLFAQPVPAALLKPEILTALGHPSSRPGSWQQVFGSDADEYFHAWYVASFIGQVAAAGKAEYPLPLYVNAALRDPITHPAAGTYESGGPTDNVIPIWKAAAPAIDLLSPDIYLNGSNKILKVIDLYSRADNTLFVPEVGGTPDKLRYLYPVLAHSGIGFAFFGVDGMSDLIFMENDYALLSKMSRQLAEWDFEGKTSALVEPEDHTAQSIQLNGWQATVTFGTGRSPMQPNKEPTGKALIIQLEKNTFLVTGTLSRITFTNSKPWEYLKVEEGSWIDGAFHPIRILNGDETDWGGPAFGDKPTLLRITLTTR